jgi:hypothetical protein
MCIGFHGFYHKQCKIQLQWILCFSFLLPPPISLLLQGCVIRGSKVTFLNSDTWCLTSHTCLYTQMEPKYILNFTFFMWSSLSIYCSPYFLLVMTANGFLQTLTMSFFQLHFIYSLLLMKILMLMCVVYFLSIYYRLHMLWRIDLNYTLSFPIIWFLFSV